LKQKHNLLTDRAYLFFYPVEYFADDIAKACVSVPSGY
jgi:hypothetical protein